MSDIFTAKCASGDVPTEIFKRVNILGLEGFAVHYVNGEENGWLAVSHIGTGLLMPGSSGPAPAITVHNCLRELRKRKITREKLAEKIAELSAVGK